MTKRIFWCVYFVLGLTAQADQPPNILFLYLDDFGWKDTSYMGSDFYETPNIDRLANHGMIFTDAYSTSANCAPARACLLSGQYTPRHQIYNVGTRPRGNEKHRRLEHIAGTNKLGLNIITWAECLKQAGYRTGMFGKWHLGPSPKAQGFDVAAEHNKIPGMRGHKGKNGEYLTDLLTERTLDFIGEKSNKPWCAYLSHYAVHTPIQAKNKIILKYQKKGGGELHRDPVMAAMIQSVDEGVGRLVSKLKKSGQRNNTVILFYSDNGGYGPATDMAPLYGYKGNYFEGGIRVPFFVNWPNKIKGGQKTDEPIIGVDIFPTLLDLSGVNRPDQTLDGVSLKPFLLGQVQTVGPRPLFWHFPCYLQSYDVYEEQRDPLFRTRPCSVIRFGEWKLHEYFEDGALQLYNLKEDIAEQKDLAKERPAMVSRLHKMLKDWRRDTNAIVPKALNPKFDKEAEAQAIHAARLKLRPVK